MKSSPDEEDHQQVMRNQAAQPPETAESFPNRVAASEDKDSLELSVEQLSGSSTPFTPLPKVSAEGTVQPAESESKGLSPGQEQTDREDGSRASEAQARLVQAEVHASLENGVKEPSSSSPSSDEKRADSDKREEEEEEDEDDGSRKDDYSEGDLIDISAYSGLGEDSGDSQLDDEDDEEDDEVYQPETSCCEIPGLPEEEEPPPANRKIRFSTAPITVSLSFLFDPGMTLGRVRISLSVS